MILDVGCGNRKYRGSIGIDRNRASQADIICDISSVPYPFRENSFDAVYIRHSLEHCQNRWDVLEELHRIAKPGAKIIVEVPHFSSYDCWAPPDHKWAFACRTFEIVCQENPKFRLEKTELRWLREANPKHPAVGIVNHILTSLANLNRHLCERIWCYWVGGFGEIYVEMKVVK